ncbi:hypothetical protein HNQ59_002414 [Chitinivorax tropicus]|uniref:Shedu protein SduA C-terminal domain-containing protein n=1 Tax=Chitinivorax tropicus TaxID=714531 RepID=A0A840MRQ5_9PROT|nr:Shedu immune nuclease family protein [Chitinivorax tropicus]MBB5019116.1 hypothetical protein [Chitinivorax tropicus]
MIAARAKERDIQNLLKSNLDLIGQSVAFAPIKDEYIVFSEFPLGNGSVDFVVFTDRSRMDVVLIEIKGADFPFVNSDGRVHADINEAAQKIRERYAYIRSNYEYFRREVHSIRKEVEAGKQRYNSLLGPNGYLHVDPEKDIDIKGIVIGGTTRDDMTESRIRHQLEIDSPRIKFESWDSWLRKNGGVGGELCDAYAQ